MIPPSIVIAEPVIQEASSEAKNSANLAISSGVPSRFNNVAFLAFFTALSGFLKALAEFQINGVSTGPGQIVFTRISGP